MRWYSLIEILPMHREYLDQRIPAHPRHVLSEPVEGRPGGWLSARAKPARDRIGWTLGRGLRPLHPEAPVPAHPDHGLHLCGLCGGVRLRRLPTPAGLPPAVWLRWPAHRPELQEQPTAPGGDRLHDLAGGAVDPEHRRGKRCDAHHRPVVGIAPLATAMFRIDCPTSKVVQPIATRRCWLLLQLRAMRRPTKPNSRRKTSRSREPT